jgi:type 1 glutamine amidotransferase
LVLCDDTWHPAATARRGLVALNGDFNFEFVEDGAAWSAERLNAFPLTVLAKANITSSKNEHLWLTSEVAAAFPNYVRRGNGLVAIHSGTSRYEQLPAMHALLGGAFVRHPEPCDVTLELVKLHPAVNGLEVFTVHDEHYFMSPLAADADVFLRSRSAHGVQPAGWTRTEGEGRVCVLTPGHEAKVWLHPAFQKLLSNALHWTAKLN